MTLVVRWTIRTAIVYLLIGFILGETMLIGKVLGWPTLLLLPMHTHLLMVGFFTQMVFGVAFWMFPADLEKKFSQSLAQWTYILLNVGLWLRVIFEIIFNQSDNPLAGWLMSIGGLLQLIAAMLFIYNMRGRVRGFLRELRSKMVSDAGAESRQT